MSGKSTKAAPKAATRPVTNSAMSAIPASEPASNSTPGSTSNPAPTEAEADVPPVEAAFCEKCNVRMLPPVRKEVPYKCGLPDVTVAVLVYECPRCSQRETSVFRVLSLHQEIARQVAHRPERLSGAEIRFLRKHLGWDRAQMARNLGASSERVATWEAEQAVMEPVAERLLRVLALAGVDFTAEAPLRFSGPPIGGRIDLRVWPVGE